MYLNKDTILSSLTNEDVIKICMTLGSPYPQKDNAGNLIFQSICHGSTSHKLYYYCTDNDYKKHLFHCFSRCSDSFNIVELVIRAHRVKGKILTWYKALYYIAAITEKIYLENDCTVTSENVISDFNWISKLQNIKRNSKNVPVLTEINENILEIFYYAPHQEWLNDNISREALSRFEIGYYGLTNQITIPHRDINNRLVGIRGRFLDPEDIDNIGKYVPLQIGGRSLSHSLGSNLYGINVTRQRIKAIKKIMLVEAEKSCMQAYSYFGDNSFVAATCGSSITRTQIKIILNQLQVEEVIYAPDRDYRDPHSYEAEIWYQKIVKRLADLVPYCKVTLCADSKNRLPYKASPTDMGKDILLELLNEKITITVDEVNKITGRG